MCLFCFVSIFFFQAEDCIRYLIVSCIHSFFFFFSSRRRHTRSDRDWSSDVCSSDLDEELLDLVELEVRELLTEYEFPGDDVPVVRVSALKALDGDPGAVEQVVELMNAVDTYVPEPVRDLDKPYLMPIEDVFSITGRGTVVTGKVEQGVIHTGDDVEIIGIKDTTKTVVTGVEMFRKLLDEGRAGDNIGVLLRGTKKEDVERGQVLAN